MPVSNIIKAAKEVFGEGGGFGSMMEAAQQAASKDNAIHMKMFGGKDVDILPFQKDSLPILKVSDSKGLIIMSHMSQEEYKNFRSLDDYHRKMFVEDFLEKHNPKLHMQLKGNEAVDLMNPLRRGLPYTSDGTPVVYLGDRSNAIQERFSFKRYPDEPLNSRLSDVKMMNVRDGRGELHMKVDGQERKFTISGDTFRAWGACALPTNVLANHVLELSEKQQMDLQTRVELGLDEQRDQGQSQSVGIKR